jgi:hypothetical protein
MDDYPKKFCLLNANTMQNQPLYKPYTPDALLGLVTKVRADKADKADKADR